MPNREEHLFLCDTMLVRNSLIKHGEAVRDRLRPTYRYIWRDIRLAVALITKIQNRLCDTFPPKRQLYYQKLAEHGRYKLDLPGPALGKNYVLADTEDLAVLTQAAMENQCAMCCLYGRELRGCRLRGALLALAPRDPADEDAPFDSCEYRDIASALARGEETRI